MELLGFFTPQGKSLSAKLLTGTGLTVTRVTAGDGETPSDATALLRDCQTLSAGPLQRSGDTVMLPVTLTATTAEANYTLRELGVYAQDPDEGEILYRIYRLSHGVAVTAGKQLTIRFDLRETVSEAAEVTVVDSSSGLLTVADLGVPGGAATLGVDGKVPQAQLPFTYGTEDLAAGSSGLETGKLYFVYE